MAKALVLDFGGVISRTLFETHDVSERTLGLKPGTLTWRGPFDPDGDELWAAMQRGEVTERDYYAQRTKEVAALTGNHWTSMRDFVQAARGANPDAIIRPEALLAIAAAKERGFRLALLSNELDLFYGKEMRKKLAFLKDFDAIVDGSYYEHIKPHPDIYLDCCAKLNVAPQDCVFVDDQVINVKGAEAVGMRAVRLDVRDPAAAFDEALTLLQQEQCYA